MEPMRRIAAFCVTCMDLVPHTLLVMQKRASCDGCGAAQEVLVPPA